MVSNEVGIYKLVHSSKPGYCYIGSTSQGFKIRLKGHLGYLRRGKHHSKFLQNVVDKYGIDGLSMEVIEVLVDVTREHLRVVEQKYIDEYIKEFGRALMFNTTTKTRCTTDDPEIMERQKAAARKNGSSEKNITRMRALHADETMNAIRVDGLRKSLCIAVMCYETGDIFQSFVEAKRWVSAKGLSNDVVGRSIGCIVTSCREPRSSAYGYHWQYVDKSLVDFDYIEEYHKHKVMGRKNSTRVCCVEEDITFASITEAKDWLVSKGVLKADKSAISLAAKGKYAKMYGYTWKKIPKVELQKEILDIQNNLLYNRV